ELRRAIGLALLYPILVLAMAYGLFVLFVTVVAPRFLEASDSLLLETSKPLRLSAQAAIVWLARIGETAIYWGPIGPILLLLVVASWVRSGRASGLAPGGLWERV